MASHTFRWLQPADEVFVTGTFDNWSKSVRLEKNGDAHEKSVELPSSSDKIYYKYVVDGKWVTDPSAPSETDDKNNTNNVLPPSKMATISSAAPESTAAALAGQVQKEPKPTQDSQPPGSFPETPGTEKAFSVNPIPGTGAQGNPKPGEENISRTVQDNVTLDKDSYEKSGAGVTAPTPPPKDDGGAVTHTIQSAAPLSTTAALAGQVPKENRSVPAVVQESQKEAHVDPEASGSRDAVSDKNRVEQELVKKVNSEQKSVNPDVQKAIDTMNADPKTAIPAAVTTSLAKADKDPEAAANPEAVREKSAVESELKREVKPAPATAPTREEESSSSAAPPASAATPASNTGLTAPSDPNLQPGSGDVSPGTSLHGGAAGNKATTSTAQDTSGSKTAAPATTGSTPASPSTAGQPGESASSAPAESSAADAKKSKRRSLFIKLKEKFK